MTEDLYVMWLSNIQGLGCKRVKDLIEYFGSAENIWNASLNTLLKVNFIPKHLIHKIYMSKDKEKVEKQLENLNKKNIQFISISNPKYPKLLKEIYDPPSILYIRGTLPDDDLEFVSIIGARRCSQYGSSVAYKLAKDLVKYNIVIVSGMARGIDSISQKGALDGGGYTIAVLGCGVDICYPPENRELMDKIIKHGCVISEYPPGTPPIGKNFPSRNRIISGLSKITVVVEAGKNSGTFITAEQALDNGRDVFAFPGNVTSPLSEGTNELIKEGCPAITSAEEILFELGIAYTNEELLNYLNNSAKGLNDEEKLIYDCIGIEGKTTEEIAYIINKPIQNLQYTLTMLEINGKIKKLHNGKYIKML